MPDIARPAPSTTTAPDRAWLAYLMLTTTMLMWSGNFIIGRGLRDILSPASFSLWRWLLTALLVAPFAWPHLKRQWPIMLRHWRILLLLSILMVSIGNTLTYYSLESTTAINAALVNAVQPVVMVVIAWLLDRDAVTPLQGLGIVLSLIGVVTVVGRADLGVILALRFNIGDLWMFVAVISFSFYAVIHRRAPRDIHPLCLLQTIALVGGIFVIPTWLGEWAAGTARMSVTAEAMAAFLYISLCASFLAILFWNRGLAIVGPNRAGVFIYLLPVFSSVLSIVLLDEHVRPYHLVGFAFIIVGIYVTTRLAARRRAGA
ncbi:MAG: DMT family transporter [Candidatus Eiseniibacteriota bacterium]